MRPAPIDLLDEDGVEYPRFRILVIGCGNVLRGDDAAGPVLVRRIWDEHDVPADVRIADGGTSGMDVVFQMRHADRVLIVDAASTGEASGTIYRVPAEQIADVPPIGGLGSHDFRWDHAVATGRWLLGDRMPENITVYLIEGEQYDFGQPLSPPVDAAVNDVMARIMAEVTP